MMVNKKKQYGQYFTPKTISDFMVNLISNKNYDTIIDSGSGKGVFIDSLLDSKINIDNLIGCEFDDKFCNHLKEKYNNNDNVNIINENYLEYEKENVDVIIGNPPYVHWNNIDSNIRKSIKKIKF